MRSPARLVTGTAAAALTAAALGLAIPSAHADGLGGPERTAATAAPDPADCGSVDTTAAVPCDSGGVAADDPGGVEDGLDPLADPGAGEPEELDGPDPADEPATPDDPAAVSGPSWPQTEEGDTGTGDDAGAVERPGTGTGTRPAPPRRPTPDPRSRPCPRAQAHTRAQPQPALRARGYGSRWQRRPRHRPARHGRRPGRSGGRGRCPAAAPQPPRVRHAPLRAAGGGRAVDRTALKARAWVVGIAALCGTWLVHNGAAVRTAAPSRPPPRPSPPAPSSGPAPGSPNRCAPPSRSGSASRPSAWTRP